jgi:predicted TIM-barrel fold metal-dependent hydrolase
MAAAYLAMNDTWGPLFGVSQAEAATPEMANDRASKLSSQFIMDMHTHFLRDDTTNYNFVASRAAVGQAGWNPALVGREQTIEDLKFANYFKEMFLDSDTKVACISNSPSDVPSDWFIPQEQVFSYRDVINKRLSGGTKRCFGHFTWLPGQPGWLDKLEAGIETYKPETIKGYTIGDNNHRDTSRWPWRLDDEKVTYKGYELLVKRGIRNVATHKGLFPPSVEKQTPQLVEYAAVGDVEKAARDWPQLNFHIFHSGYRFAGGGKPEDAWEQVQRSGRCQWVSELADMVQRTGLRNVYADVGQLFAQGNMGNPRLAAWLMGTLVTKMGADRVLWGTDAIWTGSPQWQIESLRRLEIPEDMQKQYGFKPLGAADGPVKSAIFGDNNARLYGYTPAMKTALAGDKVAQAKAHYDRVGDGRSNLAYGWVAPDAG